MLHAIRWTVTHLASHGNEHNDVYVFWTLKFFAIGMELFIR